MSDDMHTLSEDERAELERLRQEKKLREAQAQAAAERAELERLRAEQAQAKVSSKSAKKPSTLPRFEPVAPSSCSRMKTISECRLVRKSS